jgi:hypothetical protein
MTRRKFRPPAAPVQIVSLPAPDPASCSVVMWTGHRCGEPVRALQPYCSAHTARVAAGWDAAEVAGPIDEHRRERTCGVAVEGRWPCDGVAYRHGVCAGHYNRIVDGVAFDELTAPLRANPRCGWADVEICTAVVRRRGEHCDLHRVDVDGLLAPSDDPAVLLATAEALVATGGRADRSRRGDVTTRTRFEQFRARWGLDELDIADAVAAFVTFKAQPSLVDPSSAVRPVAAAGCRELVRALRRQLPDGETVLTSDARLGSVLAGCGTAELLRAPRQPRLIDIEMFRRAMTVRHQPSNAARQRRGVAVLALAGWDRRAISKAGRVTDRGDAVEVSAPFPSLQCFGVEPVTLHVPHGCGRTGGICDACLLVDADRLASGDALFRRLYTDGGTLRSNVGRPREIGLIIDRLLRDAGLAGTDPASLEALQRWRLLCFADPVEVARTQARAYLACGLVSGMRHGSLADLRWQTSLRLDDGMLHVDLARTKSDADWFGFRTTLRPLSDVALCPVDSVLRWVTLAGVTDGERVFGTTGHGPPDRTSRLEADAANAALRALLADAGVDPAGFSTGSLRHSFAAIAREAAGRSGARPADEAEAAVAAALGHRQLASTTGYGRKRRGR